ncbi:MAG: response regulator transcription factor [Anaerolineales bacterium]|nr:response regulator transcription factor [Anaerolineales bacterium]
MFRLNILIVDDSDQVRRDLRTVLHLSPDLAVLGEASNGIEAVSAAAELMPDIVLMDLRLPGLDGFEAAEQIRKRNPDQKIIMLTIYDTPENKKRSDIAGIDLFIGKSVGIDKLVASIREIGLQLRESA